MFMTMEVVIVVMNDHAGWQGDDGNKYLQCDGLVC